MAYAIAEEFSRIVGHSSLADGIFKAQGTISEAKDLPIGVSSLARGFLEGIGVGLE